MLITKAPVSLYEHGPVGIYRPQPAQLGRDLAQEKHPVLDLDRLILQHRHHELAVRVEGTLNHLGFRQLDGDVERDNPALRLYSTLGFVVVGEVGNAHTMVKTLTRR